jgi:zinc D-Ala-D-Ala dipeptidase
LKAKNSLKWNFSSSRARLGFYLSVAGVGWISSCTHPVEVRRGEPGLSALIRQRARTCGLVSVTEVDPTIVVDLRYATSDNPVGRPLYPPELPCLARDSTAQKLQMAQSYLRQRGYGLRVWDAYRPPEAHLQLWRAHSQGLFVSDPHSGWSKHCYGRAVDVTLVDANGHAVEMPSKFDDFSDKAYFVYNGHDNRIRDRLRLLQKAMKQAGFLFLDTEWWHFIDARDGEVIAGQPIWGHELGLRLP